MPELRALILIGGKSSRMGTNKFLLEVNGKPQYQFLIDLLHHLGIPAFLSCSKEQRELIPDGYPVIQDLYENMGPIGGIASAIAFDDASDWLVIACDLINLDERTIVELIDQDESAFDVVTFGMPENEFLETTITLYKVSSFKTIQSMIENEHYKLQSLLRKSAVKVVTPSDATRLKNANTPEDL